MTEIQSIVDSFLRKEYASGTSFLIQAECPLESGIRIICKKRTANGETSFSVPGLARSLYTQVQSEKKTRHFNIIKISISDLNDCRIEYIYDEGLQKKAECATK